MAYLEQSTRYVPYTDKLHGRWRYHVPAELGAGALRERYVRTMDAAFETYAKWIPAMQQHFERRYPRSAADSETVHRAAIRAKALDTLRGMLPAATQSNVGIYGTGQAFESLLLRMRANPLEEVRACADAMLVELRKLIPAFLTRVDQPDRGGRWSEYLSAAREGMEHIAFTLRGGGAAGARRGDAHRFRSGRRGQDRRGGAVPGLRAPRRSAAGDGAAHDRGRTGRRASRVRRRAHEPPPPPRPGVRADDVSLRRADRLRRVPRPAASSPADAGMAGAHAAARLYASRRRSWKPARTTTGSA